MKLNPPLFALAVAAFAIGTSEFAPMGLLPVVARDLAVSIPAAGSVVTAYALGVMGGAAVTLATTRAPRKALLVALMALFTLGNELSALAPGLGWLVAARVVAALAHATMFGVGAVVAGTLVAPGRAAQAVAAMFMGLTVANVGGVPAATALGQAIGWRWAFAGIAGLGLLAMAALALALPRQPRAPPIALRAELAVFRRPAVLLALATTVLGSGAMFAVFTYIAPILQEVAHVGARGVTLALVVYGVGLTLGNWLGGRFADRALKPTLLVVLAALVVLLLLFTVTMHDAWPAIATVFAWGVASFALVPALQVRVMQVAAEAPALASAVNIGAFNLGNAIGAAAGGAVLSADLGAGLGYPMLAVTGALLAGGGFVCVLLADFAPSRASR